MPLTPEEARKLLDSFAADTTAHDEREEVYLWWCVQRELMKGQHAGELAALHDRIVTEEVLAAQRGDTTHRSPLREQRDAILEEITAHHRERIAQEGLPASWRK